MPAHFRSARVSPGRPVPPPSNGEAQAWRVPEERLLRFFDFSGGVSGGRVPLEKIDYIPRPLPLSRNFFFSTNFMRSQASQPLAVPPFSLHPHHVVCKSHLEEPRSPCPGHCFFPFFFSAAECPPGALSCNPSSPFWYHPGRLRLDRGWIPFVGHRWRPVIIKARSFYMNRFSFASAIFQAAESRFFVRN